MIEQLQKESRSTKSNFPFCILIPSWNNLNYLKNCIASLRKNSAEELQIIVIINEGSDGTLEWVRSTSELDYVYSPENIGICYGLNACRSLVKSEYLVYVNDDMYLLPNWDKVLKEEISNIGHKSFMLSATMIEPTDTGNPCVVVQDFGNSLDTFKEKELLQAQKRLERTDWQGSTWPPNVVHIDVWDLVGGMSIEFSPGMYSDPDLSRKLYEAGVRYYKGMGKSLVYHFGSKSTRRISRNKGSKKFLLKWGITSRTFTQHNLRSGKNYTPMQESVRLGFASRLINKLKRMKTAAGNN